MIPDLFLFFFIYHLSFIILRFPFSFIPYKEGKEKKGAEWVSGMETRFFLGGGGV